MSVPFALPLGEHPPVDVVDPDGRFVVGRWRAPISGLNFDQAQVEGWPWPMGDASPIAPMRALRRLRLKEWHYLSVVGGRYMLALAPVQLGFASNLFVYLVDRQTGTKWEYGERLPLGAGLKVADSSINGTTRWKTRKARVEVEANPMGWHLVLDVPMGGDRLTAEIDIVRSEALALVYPFEGGRAAYTHKEVGLVATGRLKLGAIEWTLDEALAASDWTRSYAQRRTEWFWASVSGRSDGARLGLNLSARVYDDDQGASQENALWVNGKLHPLGVVHFTMGEGKGAPWRIVGEEGGRRYVDLTFQPHGERTEDADYRVIVSRFVQPYGVFYGTVVDGEGITRSFHECYGVVEFHQSVW